MGTEAPSQRIELLQLSLFAARQYFVTTLRRLYRDALLDNRVLLYCAIHALPCVYFNLRRFFGAY